MERQQGRIARAAAWMHHHFLGLLLVAYAVAGLAPAVGLWIRGVTFGHIDVLGESTGISLPLLLLSFLLFNAGLGVRIHQVLRLLSDPRLLLLGLAANVLVPIAFIHGIAPLLGLWPDPEEAQVILIGLALVAAMPIAGSSTSWSQQNDGDLPLSIGLVFFSTLLSPWTTPLIVHAIGPLFGPEHAGALQSLGGKGTGILLSVFVIVPVLLGMIVGGIAGPTKFSRARSGLKFSNSCCLLLLIYANAAMALPASIAEADLDFLLLIVVAVSAACATAFFTGWIVARLLKADESRQRALLFGLGMNNNGTGLVLAALLLADYPRVLLPILIYNLVQHLVAGAVSRLMTARAAKREATSAANARSHTPVFSPLLG